MSKKVLSAMSVIIFCSVLNASTQNVLTIGDIKEATAELIDINIALQERVQKLENRKDNLEESQPLKENLENVEKRIDVLSKAIIELKNKNNELIQSINTLKEEKNQVEQQIVEETVVDKKIKDFLNSNKTKNSSMPSLK
jgi:septal ring factor EnvC (AmiA/AmiB activator)